MRPWRVLSRIVVTWLIASVLIGLWAWIFRLAGFPLWYDVVFTTILVFSLIRFVATPAKWLSAKRVGRIGSWAFFGLALSTGIYWTIGHFPDALELFNLFPRFIGTVASTIQQTVARLQFSASTDASLWVQFAVICLSLGLAVIAAAISIYVVLITTNAAISRNLRTRLASRSIRLGRWRRAIRRFGFIIVIVIVFLGALALVENASIPKVSFEVVASLPQGSAQIRRVISSTYSSRLFALTSAGVFSSTNNGLTWQPASSNLWPGGVINALVSDERHGSLYAATNSGLWQLGDNAIFWSHVNLSSTISVFSSYGYATILSLNKKDDTLFAVINNEVYRSSDNGQSWTTLVMPIDYINSLAVDDDTGTLYALGSSTSTRLYRSSDGGQQWEIIGAGLPLDQTASDLLLDVQHNVLYLTVGGILHRSTDRGNTFQSISDKHFSDVTLNHRNGTLYMNTHGRLLQTTDQGKNWNAVCSSPICSNVLSFALDEDTGTLFVSNYAGIFRSSDGGQSWQPSIMDPNSPSIYALLIDDRDSMLYANADGVIFRSVDDGASWQAANAGLTGVVIALLLDKDSGTLYALTYTGSSGNTLSRSTDGGRSWQTQFSPFDYWYSLALNEHTGTLYAWSSRQGPLRSLDGGKSWQTTQIPSRGYSYISFVIDNDRNTVYALNSLGALWQSVDDGEHWKTIDTSLSLVYPLIQVPDSHLVIDVFHNILYANSSSAKVVRSTDGGQNWQNVPGDLGNSYINCLIRDMLTNDSYACASNGAYRSSSNAEAWQRISNGLPNAPVIQLALNEQQGILFAATANGVYLSRDGGSSWQAANSGLSTTRASILISDSKSGTLFAIANNGVLRSTDGGRHWGIASSLAANTMIIDDGSLYASSQDDVLKSTDNGESWQITRLDETDTGYAIQRTLFSQQPGLFATGVVLRNLNDTLTWVDYGGDINSLQLTRDPVEPLTLWQSPIGKEYVVAAQAPLILRAELDPPYPRTSLVWFVWRALVDRVAKWLSANVVWVFIALAFVALLIVAWTYANLARPFGLPVWALLFARNRLESYARPASLEAAWLDWRQMISGELQLFGDVTVDDVWRIPSPLRQYALHRYADMYAPFQNLEIQPKRLRLLVGDRLKRWHRAWNIAARDLTDRPGLTSDGQRAVDELASVLSEALGLNIDVRVVRDFQLIRGYRVEAPALRLRIPLRFPLLFVSDLKPGDHTVQMLVDAVDVLKETDYFALVIPLEPRARQLDLPEQLRQAVNRSKYPHDLIVLGQADVLDMLQARQPERIAAQLIMRQRDLSVISPFVTSGPVPETMFFGRDAEIKTLYDMSGRADFAIVGNRKIGKTSLLQRARARIEMAGRVQVLTVDCQTVRDATGFLNAVQELLDWKLLAPTPEGFALAVHERAARQPLVFIMDEVDALLTQERSQGEPLAATWRQLAQAGECHFVFGGSTGLARRLKDPHSVFFNFPQPMPLGYLSPDTARQVLEQPLETLGLELEDHEALVNAVVDLTSGHPNFIQYLGRELVNAANRRRERRILLSDLAAIRASTEFGEYFVRTVWGEAGPLEKLITLLAPPEDFQVNEIENALSQRDIRTSDEAVDESLHLLCIYAILEKQGLRYRFMPRLFPELLRQTQDIDRLINQEKRNLTQVGVL